MEQVPTYLKLVLIIRMHTQDIQIKKCQLKNLKLNLQKHYKLLMINHFVNFMIGLESSGLELILLMVKKFKTLKIINREILDFLELVIMK